YGNSSNATGFVPGNSRPLDIDVRVCIDPSGRGEWTSKARDGVVADGAVGCGEVPAHKCTASESFCAVGRQDMVSGDCAVEKTQVSQRVDAATQRSRRRRAFQHTIRDD